MSSVKRESKKSTKETKKETQIKEESQEETQEEMQDTKKHSIWYGLLKSNTLMTPAKLFHMFLTDLTKEFIDEEGFDSILQTYWGKPLAELEEFIKSENKREKHKKNKEIFTPENLNKPINA